MTLIEYCQSKGFKEFEGNFTAMLQVRWVARGTMLLDIDEEPSWYLCHYVEGTKIKYNGITVAELEEVLQAIVNGTRHPSAY